MGEVALLMHRGFLRRPKCFGYDGFVEVMGRMGGVGRMGIGRRLGISLGILIVSIF